MRILKLNVNNVKKIKLVSVTPKSNIVQVTGPNGAGKSTLIDCIPYAIGGKEELPSHPLRVGAYKGGIELLLGEKGTPTDGYDVKVTRTFSGKGTQLNVVEAVPSGRSPQKILDDLYGTLTFDPMEFSRLKPDKQLEVLRGMVKLDVDVDELDKKNASDYVTRTDVNKEVKKLEVKLGEIELPLDPPPALIDTAQLVQDMQDAVEFNKAITKERETRKSMWEKVGELRKQAKDLINKAREIELNIMPETPGEELMDIATISTLINAASSQNSTYHKVQEHKELEKMLEDNMAKAAYLTGQIAYRTQLKQETIAAAKMPVPGLGFGDGEVLFNGLPLEQASDFERLRISIVIAMAANPKLKVLRVKQGDLIDDKNWILLEELAEEGGYQIWVESCHVHDGVGAAVVMEDGEVVS